uniref:Uncharacterized protein n=1 Tax=Roseihalotalea indica TaxID=2867963 RepID=A0AA49JH48_9BACT|nr:hypothetical protein K4G66_06880 [Tunicatimonas sp. TK19036]
MNLHDALIKEDQKRQRVVNDPAREAQVLLKEQGLKEENAIKQLGLHESLYHIHDPKQGWMRYLQLNKQFKGEVYHVDDIRKVCVNYRMRMLPSRLYRGPIDPEFGTKLNRFQQEQELTKEDLEYDFYIVAPSETFDLEKRQRPIIDPLLLYKIDHDHYKLVHQWGADLHPLRYIQSWRHRNLVNMTVYWTAMTFLITMVLFGFLAESMANAFTIASVFTFLVGWGFYSTLRDNFEEQKHRFSCHNWNQWWTF